MKKTIFLCYFLISLAIFSKTILIIESYHKEFDWDISYNRGLRKMLDESYNIENFYMDTKRLPESKFQEMADKAWRRYKKLKPDLVVLGDDNALKYMIKRLSTEDVPVVFLGINNNPRYYMNPVPKNFTGVLERPLLKRSIAFIKEIKPDIENVMILFDSGLTSQLIFETVFQNKKKLKIEEVEVEFELVKDYEIWKKLIHNSDKHDAVILGLYQILSDKGSHVDEKEVLKWSSENTKVPIFAFWDFAVGKEKTIGGYVMSGEEQGKVAGKLIKRILENGEKPEFIYFETAERGRFIFSEYQLKRFGIKLPMRISQEAEFVY